MTATPFDDLTTPPTHLVDAPRPQGLGRLSVGTAPFNAVAIATLVIMAAFVVLSPDSAMGLAERPSRDVLSVTSRRSPIVPTDDNASRRARLADAAPTGTPPTTVAAPADLQLITDVTQPRTPRVMRPAPAPTTTAPPAVRAPRCEDFARQPDAQAFFDFDPATLAGFDGDRDGLACEQLPGAPLPATPAAPSAPAAVPTKADLLRPSTRLFGVHTPLAPFNMTGVESFSADAGKNPNTVLYFQNFSQEYSAVAVANAWSRQMLPVVTLEPIIKNSTSGQPHLADIANGAWDDYLNRWANAAKLQNLPIALRFAQEMNGDWYSWSEGKFGNRTGDYIRAWRHVRDLFDAAGADNIIWVWSPNRVDNLADRTLARVYPGDRYVDWVGMSGYYRDSGPGIAPSFDGTFAKTLAELKRVAPTKLILLTEVGAGTSESNRTAWIQSFFAGLLAHPEIIGFAWFNDFKSGGDWRIAYSGATASAFAAGVADPRYGSLAPRV